MHPRISQGFKRFTAFWARPIVPFIALPVLMVILVAGTVAQRSIGLYDAQRYFFSSPPALIVLGVMTFSLLCKFLFFSTWSRARAGINLAHLGVLVLLIGGLFTALSNEEGSLTIAEGQTASMIQDYHQREMAIAVEGSDIAKFPFPALKPGQVIPLSGYDGARVEILATCRNCRLDQRVAPIAANLRSMARAVVLMPDAPSTNDEQNLNGVTLRLTGTGAETDGIYIAVDLMPRPITIKTEDGRSIELIMTKAQRPLPFSVTLNDFQATHHPGTDIARTYHSDIIVHDGAVEWPVRVEMNKPLRYRGYTLFQSSFFTPAEPGAAEYTILAVVRNSGWLFPYIGTAIMAIGLVLHTVIMVATPRRKAGAA